MKDQIQEYLSEYREKFKKEAAKRKEARKLEDDLANLGCDVIEKGAFNILKQYNVDKKGSKKGVKKSLLLTVMQCLFYVFYAHP